MENIDYKNFLIQQSNNSTSYEKAETIRKDEIKEKLNKQTFIIKKVMERRLTTYDTETKKFENKLVKDLSYNELKSLKAVVKDVVSKKDGKTYKVPVWSDETPIIINLEGKEYIVNSKTSLINSLKTAVAGYVCLDFEKVFQINPAIAEGFKVRLNIAGTGIDTKYTFTILENVGTKQEVKEEVEEELSAEDMKNIIIEEPTVEDIGF